MANNKGARSKGGRAEALLQSQLINKGFEVRRTHLSAFPDIIAWNNSQILLIEVKLRTLNKARTNRKTIVNSALRMFNNSANELKVVHNDADLLFYLRIDDEWNVYKWSPSGSIEIESLIDEER